MIKQCFSTSDIFFYMGHQFLILSDEEEVSDRFHEEMVIWMNPGQHNSVPIYPSNYVDLDEYDAFSGALMKCDDALLTPKATKHVARIIRRFLKELDRLRSKAPEMMRYPQPLNEAEEPDLELDEWQIGFGYKCGWCGEQHAYVPYEHNIWIPDDAGISCFDAEAAAIEPDLTIGFEGVGL